MGAEVEIRPYARWRAATLVGVHLLFITHFVHWKLNGRTLAPLEFNEVLYTLHQGIVTAGFILMAVVMLATLVFGRFFCSWGCHILALQDLAGLILRRLGIRRPPLRSRTLVWVPMGVMFYMFIWPQILSAWHGVPEVALRTVEAGTSGGWSSFMTDDFWRNLPPMEVALLTFFICGFLIVYLLGSRGFCFQACPYGALFAVADQFAPGRIALTGNCTQCGICTASCTSDILVHREIAEHGMVASSRCLKDLDCVASCPEQALSFAFRKPPLFGKGHPLGTYAGRYSLSLSEDLLVLLVFVLSAVVLRGLYDAVPLLMAIGAAVCVAVVALFAVRLVRVRSVSSGGLVLKKEGRLTRPGTVFASGAMLLLLFIAHSGLVKYHIFMGERIFREIAADAGHAESHRLARGIYHFEKALNIGLIRPADHLKALANLQLLAGSEADGLLALQGIVEKDADNAEVNYRLGVLAAGSGDTVLAWQYFEQALSGRIRPHSGDASAQTSSLLAMGDMAERRGATQKAATLYAQALRQAPDDPRPLVAMGLVELKAGDAAAAVDHFEQAMLKGGDPAMLHNNLAMTHLRMKRPDAAVPHLQELCRLRPTDPEAHYVLAGTLAQLGRNSEAQAVLRQVLALSPEHTKAQAALDKLTSVPNR